MKRHFYRDWHREHQRHWNYHASRYKIFLALVIGWTARGMDDALLSASIACTIAAGVAWLYAESQT